MSKWLPIATASLLGALLVCAGCPRELQGQVAVGVHGTFLDWLGGAWGGGGRVAVVVHSSPLTSIAVEGIGEYVSPNCALVGCKVAAFHANVLARRPFRSVSEPYAGVGMAYERYTVESDAASREGSDWGVNLIAGSLFGQPESMRLFLELRWSLMFDISSQFGVAAGVRFPLH